MRAAFANRLKSGSLSAKSAALGGPDEFGWRRGRGRGGRGRRGSCGLAAGSELARRGRLGSSLFRRLGPGSAGFAAADGAAGVTCGTGSGRSAGVSLPRGSTLALSGLASAGFSAGLLSGFASSAGIDLGRVWAWSCRAWTRPSARSSCLQWPARRRRPSALPQSRLAALTLSLCVLGCGLALGLRAFLRSFLGAAARRASDVRPRRGGTLAVRLGGVLGALAAP